MANFLPLGAKVFIVDAYPDPYFYFAANREDLRLEYSHTSVTGVIGLNDRSDEVIKTADYVIIGQYIKDILENKYYEKYKLVIPYMLANSASYVSVKDAELVIFDMRKITKNK